MKNKIDNIPGYIKWLRSKNMCKDFPMFVASADVDYVTDGLCSATSMTDKLIAIGHVTNEEYNLNHEGIILFEQRMNNTIPNKHLRVISINKIIKNSPNAKNLSFKEFSKQYQPVRCLPVHTLGSTVDRWIRR